MEDRTVADWMGTSDSIQQSAILDNITASMHELYFAANDLRH
jgi:hypothetical protein